MKADSNAFVLDVTSVSTANKPGDSIPPLSQLTTSDGAVWTFVKGHAFRNGVDTKQPYADTSVIYINDGGNVWLHSKDHGYLCWSETKGWSWGSCGHDGGYF
jgi:hypothetical protein